MQPRKPPLFVDLDETLIFARDAGEASASSLQNSQRVFDYDVVLRPEAHELLAMCRAGHREVFLFTSAFFNFALTVAETFGLGFTEKSIFSIAMILNCRRGISPRSALIENLPAHAEPTKEKMLALGISPENLWLIPSFKPPRFPSAKLFLLGLPLRLERLDRAARLPPDSLHKKGR